MDLGRMTKIISIAIIVICIVLGIVIYNYTGNVLIILLFAPPIIYWILRKQANE